MFFRVPDPDPSGSLVFKTEHSDHYIQKLALESVRDAMLHRLFQNSVVLAPCWGIPKGCGW